MTDDDIRSFWLGSPAGLKAFREQLLADRGRIENELEAAVNVILDLLDRGVARLDVLETELGMLVRLDVLEAELEP